MKLSEQLLQDHNSGGFGQALCGYSEIAKQLEDLVEAVAHIGVDWGYGVFELTPEHIEKARTILGMQQGENNGKL